MLLKGVLGGFQGANFTSFPVDLVCSLRQLYLLLLKLLEEELGGLAGIALHTLQLCLVGILKRLKLLNECLLFRVALLLSPLILTL